MVLGLSGHGPRGSCVGNKLEYCGRATGNGGAYFGDFLGGHQAGARQMGELGRKRCGQVNPHDNHSSASLVGLLDV